MAKTLPVLYAGCSALMIQWEHVTYTHPFDSGGKENILYQKSPRERNDRYLPEAENECSKSSKPRWGLGNDEAESPR